MEELPRVRYFVVCRKSMDGREGPTLIYALDEMVLRSDEMPSDQPITIVAGLALTESDMGKSFGVRSWARRDGMIVGLLSDFVKIPRQQDRPFAVAWPWKIPIAEPGLYGVDLIDRDGLFGPRGTLLARQQFGVYSPAAS